MDDFVQKKKQKLFHKLTERKQEIMQRQKLESIKQPPKTQTASSHLPEQSSTKEEGSE